MLHLRRYRYFVLATAIVLFLLYRVSRNDDPWNSLTVTKPPNSYAGSANTGYQNTFDESDTPDKAKKPIYDDNTAAGSLTNDNDDAAAERELNKIKIPELKENEDTSDHTPGKPGQPPATKPSLQQDEDEDDDEADNTDDTTSTGNKAPSVIDIPDRKITPPDSAKAGQQDKEDDSTAASTAIHWKKMPENFPVPTESIIPLPTGKPEKIPRIQYQFKEESAAAREKRLDRLSQVEAEAKRAWTGYKKYAWKHDELSPISKKFRDPFCGWAATIVDSLDTLWIMGMKEEFEDAVEAVGEIDFTTSPRSEIPVFETTIRYLGGLIAAYDVSGGKTGGYTILLDKAIELAEILMGVFDTPNRMPVLYYNWKPESVKRPKRASSSSNLAELGSLSMEFTRLAQITKDDRYYDAVARITDALYEWQERGTTLDGIFPDRVDATGCNKTAEAEIASQKAAEAQRVLDSESRIKAPDDYSGTGNSYQGPGHNQGAGSPLDKRDDEAAKLETRTSTAISDEQAKCVPQGLTAGPYGMEAYSMGGGQDSTYEYFPKQFLLLGGLEPKYRTMHLKTVEAVKKWLLFRPMTPDDRDILFSAKIQTRGSPETDAVTDFEVAHLTCFIGGMFGMGGKIFDQPIDVEIAKKLTDGCVWAYESMPSGIMPEGASAVPCESVNDCHWNETVWWRHLDPFADTRDEQLEDYYRLQEEAKATKAQTENEEKAKKLTAEAEERVGDKPPKEHLSGTGDEGWGSSGSSANAKDDDDVYGAGESTSNLRDGRLTGRSLSDVEDSTGDGHLEKRTPPPPVEKNLDRARLGGHGTTPTKTTGDADDRDQVPLDLDDDPARPQSHKEFVQSRIENERIPPGFAEVNFQGYILRYVADFHEFTF